MTQTEQNLAHKRNQLARDAAIAAVDGLTVVPTGVVQYSSRGRVLVVGNHEAQLAAARIESPLHAQVLLREGEEEPGVPVIPQAGRELAISGHLGAFVIELGAAGKANHETIETDIVLDLGEDALITSEIPPPGYWHADLDDPLGLESVMAEISDMVGTFEKPRYFNYDPDICAHSRSGRPGCNRWSPASARP